jgi:hypothetical protein
MRRQAKLIVVLLAAVLAVAFAATRVGRTGTAEIELKQTEAQAVLAELQRLDADLGTMVEKYNGARLRLDELESLLTVNSERLRRSGRSGWSSGSWSSTSRRSLRRSR